MSRAVSWVGRMVLVVVALPVGLSGQESDSIASDTLRFFLDPVEVTATRTARPVFLTPAPVQVFDADQIGRSSANTITDLFRDAPGLDLAGVGVQQPRPIIRGQRGQRILLLEDGVRLGNSRRQQDFGEVPSLVDLTAVERLEIVRGPASVLYGTDAIGGVINLVTRAAPRTGFVGRAGYRFGSANDQSRVWASLGGREGRVDFSAGGSWRTAGDYSAPQGSFGEIDLTAGPRVLDSGVQDQSLRAELGVATGDDQRAWARFEAYAAEDAGFGLVEPSLYAPMSPRIRITYPDQDYRKITLGYTASQLDMAVADRVELVVYSQDNTRDLSFDFTQSLGPEASLAILTNSRSDLSSEGFRLEAKKLAGGVLLTYGADLFRDASAGGDTTRTTVLGFGPPVMEVSTRPQVPDARFRSAGAFFQAEAAFGNLDVIGGVRVQDVAAASRATEGLDLPPEDRTDNTVVGALNAIFHFDRRWSAVAGVGTAFRSPNLIEWYFEGPVAEAAAYQRRNPDLVAEKALNVDLGVRFKDRRVQAEVFAFRNRISDGIRAQATGQEVNGLAEFQNVNLEELEFRGVEAAFEVALVDGFSLHGTHTHLESEDRLEPTNPVGETFSDKTTAGVRYRSEGDRFWAGYDVRHNGDRKDIDLGTNPLGDVIPGFTTHALRGGVTVRSFEGLETRLTMALINLTDALYSESANGSFFRPEPGRAISLGVEVEF